MTRTKPRSTVRKNRLKQANKNHESLISTYQEYFISDEDLAKTALNHLLHLNRRHRLKMPKKIKETYCNEGRSTSSTIGPSVHQRQIGRAHV